jgi:hypothetical protein
MPRFPVNKSGAISVPFVFNIQRYDSIPGTQRDEKAAKEASGDMRARVLGR